MPTNKELLESVRGEFERLEVFDGAALNSVRNRAEMLIEQIFGDDSPYIERLRNITFRRNMVVPSSSSGGVPAEIGEARKRHWRSGQEESVSLINTMLEHLELREARSAQTSEDQTVPRSNRVFVAHGYDDGMRESVARVLTKLGLNPVILHELPDQGRTIIEKFYEHSDVGFAMVLLSPDDTGYSNAIGANGAKPRARQIVILELGFFLGKLGRSKVVALHRGDLEIPSDFSGVLYTPYDPGGAWQYRLTGELQASGYSVSADDLRSLP
jgi:predicted nucleotide-binding protein